MQLGTANTNVGGAKHRDGGVLSLLPEPDDIVVRQHGANPTVVYVLGTPSIPDLETFHTRDEALWQAFLYAERHLVRAWYARDGHGIVLLGTFRKGTKAHHISEVSVMAKATKRAKAGTAPTTNGTPQSPASRSTTEGDIALRAYQFYEDRGGEHGHDLDDWLRAEEELQRAVGRGN